MKRTIGELTLNDAWDVIKGWAALMTVYMVCIAIIELILAFSASYVHSAIPRWVSANLYFWPLFILWGAWESRGKEMKFRIPNFSGFYFICLCAATYGSIRLYVYSRTGFFVVMCVFWSLAALYKALRDRLSYRAQSGRDQGPLKDQV